MALYKTARAIIPVYLTFPDSNKKVVGVLLELDRGTGKYCLPGGKFQKNDYFLERTVIREVKEELGINNYHFRPIKVYVSYGSRAEHHIYSLPKVSGTLQVDCHKFMGIGFGFSPQNKQIPSPYLIPEGKLENHVVELKKNYFGTDYETVPLTNIVIPEGYLYGDTLYPILSWQNQVKSGFNL